MSCKLPIIVKRSFPFHLAWVAVLLTVSPLHTEEKLPPPRTHYLGREIAQTMSYHGAPWLIRPERQQEENCIRMLKHLGVQSGMKVCDMGCGNGYYSLRLAKLVGQKGQVLAVDIQPEMLTLLRARAAKAEIDTIHPVLGTVADPRLPSKSIDVILCVDVYHEFSHPERMLRAMRESLAPNGVVVLVEYREEDPDVPIKPLHKMSKRQVSKELKHNGFQLVREYDGLPWQHMMFFGVKADIDQR